MKQSNLAVLGGVVIILFLLVVIVLWPLVIIFAVNTLFPLLSIPYSFLSWLCVVILNMSTFGGIHYQLNKIKEKL